MKELRKMVLISVFVMVVCIMFVKNDDVIFFLLKIEC